MFRRGRRCLAIALMAAGLALSAGPAAAAGRDTGTRTVRMELWAWFDQIGDWLRTTFLSDGTSFIDPDG